MNLFDGLVIRDDSRSSTARRADAFLETVE